MNARTTLAAVLAALAFGNVTACAGQEDSEEIERSDLGDKWPLTVDRGTLRCEGSGGIGDVIFTTEDGTEYSVNGAAKSTGKYEDIMEIWADNPDVEGLKVDMSALTERGLALCD